MTEKQPPQSQNTAPDFNKLEEEVLSYWEERNIPERHLKQNEGKEPYIFYDGPPFATGTPHYGHILASTIKDAIPRYHVMRGKYVRRRWGWDCHGLPIENIVEQNLKISGKKQIEEVGVERFNKVCRENVLSYVAEWGKMVRRMARWIDFDNSYKTMDTAYMESVWWALKQTWEKGLIYEDRKVLLYCSRCETPISNFEVAMDNSYRQVTEESVYVKFKVFPKQRIVNDLTDDNTYILAWTTTPWTLPGNAALHVGPDFKYVLVEQEKPTSSTGKERYLLGKERLEILEGTYEIVSEFSARSLEGLEYEPVYSGIVTDTEGKVHRVYIDDFVTVKDGTGVVHSAVMYGEEDFLAAKKRGLPQTATLDHKGQYLENVPEFLRGVFFKDAEKPIIQNLESRGLLYKKEHFTHSYPHCYRCSTPLYYNALPAWFVDVQKIKPELLRLNEEVNWYPGHLKNGRFGKSMEMAPDWNISRNRFWATALPFWKCFSQECKAVVCIGSVSELIQKSTNFSAVYPAYDDKRLEDLDLHRPYIDQIVLQCEACGGSMHRVPEVVDCWVESASMPFAELHYPFENQELYTNRFPADFVAEYIGQTRAWFYVMHVMSAVINGAAPFKHVVTTGNILAEDGSKMSKSKKNYPDPWLLIHKYGVDALRFYLLTSPVMSADDVSFSEKLVAEVYRKISIILWNVLGFYNMYASGPLSEEFPVSDHVLDVWVLNRLLVVQIEVTQNLDSYNTVKAGRVLAEFINDLSTWYLRRSRDRIKSADPEGERAVHTLGYVLAETAKLIAPFMPYLAEYIYREVTGKESVHFSSWTESGKHTLNLNALEHMKILREIVETGLALRKGSALKVRQPLAALEYLIKDKDFEFNDAMHAILAEELNVKNLVAVNAPRSTNGWINKDTPSVNISLNINLTPELQAEGTARELERHIQDLRKQSKLKVGDVVDVYYNTQDPKLGDILISQVDRKKTFINQIQTSLEVEVDFEIQAKVNGSAIWIGLIKV